MIVLIAKCKITKKGNRTKLQSYHSQPLSTLSSHSISKESKGPLCLASDGKHYIFVRVGKFRNYLVTVPASKSKFHFCVIAIENQRISKIGPFQNLITDGGTEFFNF